TCALPIFAPVQLGSHRVVVGAHRIVAAREEERRLAAIRAEASYAVANGDAAQGGAPREHAKLSVEVVEVAGGAHPGQRSVFVLDHSARTYASFGVACRQRCAEERSQGNRAAQIESQGSVGCAAGGVAVG